MLDSLKLPQTTLSETCSKCGSEVGQGIALQTQKLYGMPLCVRCGVRYGRWN